MFRMILGRERGWQKCEDGAGCRVHGRERENQKNMVQLGPSVTLDDCSCF